MVPIKGEKMEKLANPRTWKDVCRHCEEYICFDLSQSLYVDSAYEVECLCNELNGHHI